MRLALILLVVLSTSGCLGSYFEGGNEEEPKDYIRGSYTKWVIEIDHVEGQRPTQSAVDTLRMRLQELVHKDLIDIRIDDVVPGRSTWSQAQLDALHAELQDEQTGGDTVVTHVLYVDGEYERSSVLGVASAHDQVTIFKQRIQDGCQAVRVSNPLAPCVGQETTIETAVLVHEFGHILGLVNRGVPMVNEHEGTGDDGRYHSSNPDSVMYKAVDSTGVFGLDNSIPTTFDADDKLDICAYGGKGNC